MAKRNNGNNNQGSKWIRPEKRLAIYHRAGWKCEYCSRNLKGLPSHMVHLDHMTPRIYGGSNLHDNLVMACWACNDSKQDRSIEEWAPHMAAKLRRAAKRPIDLNKGKELLALKKAITA